MIVIVIVLLAVIGLAFAVIPNVFAPARPLDCPNGVVILNGVTQCYPTGAP
jgi:hypothetical protein